MRSSAFKIMNPLMLFSLFGSFMGMGGPPNIEKILAPIATVVSGLQSAKDYHTTAVQACQDKIVAHQSDLDRILSVLENFEKLLGIVKS